MDFSMIVTYIVVDFFCILQALSMGLCINTDFGSEFEVKELRRALWSYCGFLVAGLIWLLTQNHYFPYITAIVWIANMLSMFLLSLSSYYWFLFATSKLSRSRMVTKRFIYLSLIPILIAAVLCFSSPLTGWVFSISPEAGYTRGPFFTYMFLLGYLYDIFVLGYAIVRFVKDKDHKRRRLSLVIGAFVLFPMSAGVIQIVVTGTPIMAPAIMSGFFLVFIIIQSDQVYNDALTGLNNRRKANQYLAEQISSFGESRSIYVYVMDVNSFKQVNDRFGHVEGDRALGIISKALLRLCNSYHVFVARYGGDEFLVVANSHNVSEPDNICAGFEKILNEECAGNHLTYELTACIGYTKVISSGESVEDIIKRADQSLYEEKKQYHSQRSNSIG